MHSNLCNVPLDMDNLEWFLRALNEIMNEYVVASLLLNVDVD